MPSRPEEPRLPRSIAARRGSKGEDASVSSDLSNGGDADADAGDGDGDGDDDDGGCLLYTSDAADDTPCVDL
eukprot:1739062-Pleurochrysis_carterae.AAC.2